MPKEGEGGGGKGLRISSDKDVRMGEKPKNKIPKNRLGFKQNPQKISAPKVLVSNTKKIPT